MIFSFCVTDLQSTSSNLDPIEYSSDFAQKSSGLWVTLGTIKGYFHVTGKTVSFHNEFHSTMNFVLHSHDKNRPAQTKALSLE